MVREGLPTLTAHNLLLEVFVSSGLIGLLAMGYLTYRLIRHLLHYHYQQSPVFFMGLFRITAFLSMGQFDLKLSSFRFIASTGLFLGLLYSQRIERAQESIVFLPAKEKSSIPDYTS